MQLKEFMFGLIGSPEQEPSQAVYLVDCPQAVDEDYAEAVGRAEVALNYFSIGNTGVFIGSTEYLRKSVAHLSPEDLDKNWTSVCDMMGW